MKRSLLLVLLVFALTVPAAFAQTQETSTTNTTDTTTTQGAEVQATEQPKIQQVVGDTEAKLAPSIYPMFLDVQGSDATCNAYLMAQFKVQTKDEDDGTADSGLSLAPIYLKSKYGNGWTGGQKVEWTALPGLAIKGFTIPEENRKTANILVTWTARIEGAAVEGYKINTNICDSNWEGSTTQLFPSGDVKTKLVVNGKVKGQEASMTIPDGGKKKTKEEKPKPPPGDPTHTGSYLITPADFDGLLPATLDFEIRWKNETSQELTSPAKMRNLIITLYPNGKPADVSTTQTTQTTQETQTQQTETNETN